jgi:small subunit ribosomal protein S10e
LVAKKDFNAPKHPDMDVPNLQVIKAMQSLESRGYVKIQFSWQYYYYTLTDAGIQYLRDYLHLPAEIVPATFKKTARPTNRPSALRGTLISVWLSNVLTVLSGDGDRRRDDGYRRRPAGDKKEAAPGGFRPEFVS